ncbi:hypothetical protein EMCG_09142 [[Emmonsia] crescens]|uniref:Uncharacterized protein n=1 Tax=[Emmonsia] crescens TaxID=73230 RepID=A0A0G2JA19_9EURO|nr:hypothetical protein EMCG_09142 [Emmonsia crescens UAMH 3008]
MPGAPRHQMQDHVIATIAAVESMREKTMSGRRQEVTVVGPGHLDGIDVVKLPRLVAAKALCMENIMEILLAGTETRETPVDDGLLNIASAVHRLEDVVEARHRLVKRLRFRLPDPSFWNGIIRLARGISKACLTSSEPFLSAA